MGKLRQDAQAFLRNWDKDGTQPGVKTWLRLVLLTPGYQLLIMLRLQRFLAGVALVGKPLRRVVWYWTTIFFSCDIDPAAEIGPGLYVPHPTGIVIGGGVRLGADVSILQNVTLGRRGKSGKEPVIGTGASIGAGAVIFGAVIVGENAQIGANSVVTKDVPPGRIAVGVPAVIVGREPTTELPVGEIA